MQIVYIRDNLNEQSKSVLGVEIRKKNYTVTNSIFFSLTFTTLWANSTDEKIMTLRKHAYSNIWKISPPKTENFQIKNSDIFHISAQNRDCGYSLELSRRGGSNEYPQSMFYAVIRKIMYTPVNPSFTV